MPNDRESLLDLLARWENLAAQGQDVSPEELCEYHPELLDEVRLGIEKLRSVAWMNKVDGGTGLPPDDSPRDPGRDTDLPRTLAGRYRLDKLIGEGGFGRVYQGYDPELDRSVAVKIPRPDRLASPDQADLFRQEAKRVAQLRHPGIVPVFDVGEENGVTYIISDLIEGTSLATEVRGGTLSYVECARIVGGVAEHLQVAHERGFVHRDVKPANILIDGQGRVFLTDFGISVATGERASDDPPSGTLPYMAPELLDGSDQGTDPRSDIYSLGVVLFELLAGRLPVRARTPQELLAQVRSMPPFQGVAFEPPLPEPLIRICGRCLAEDPAQRFSSAGEVATALRGFFREVRATRSSPGSRGRRALPIILMIVAIAVIAFEAGRILSRKTSTGPGEVIVKMPEQGGRPPVQPIIPRVMPPSEGELSRPSIDLRTMIDPKRDAVEGRWWFEGRALVAASEKDQFSRIVIPHHPGHEYVLRIVLRRKKGYDAVVLGLRAPKSQFLAIFDTGPGIVSGLALLDGVHLNNFRNETRFIGGVIPMDQETTILCAVRREGVHVTCNGSRIIDWRGDPGRLSLPDPWSVLDKQSLFLGLHDGITRFERIDLIPLER